MKPSNSDIMKSSSTKETKFNNVEMLRFLFAWAIVGFHIVCDDAYDIYGLSFLKPFLYTPHSSSVAFFFVIAFFFLITKQNPKFSLLRFFTLKWFRLAPLLIVVTIIGYILYLTYHPWGWVMSSNIESILLIQDWTNISRFSSFITPAWWCHVYMLVSVFYLGLTKTFKKRHMPFIIGVIAYMGWRTYILEPVLPSYGSIMMHCHIGMALMCLGIAFLVTNLPCMPIIMIRRKNWAYMWSFVELGCLCAILGHLFAHSYTVQSYNTAILAFGIIFYLFINHSGYISRLLETPISAILGRYAYAIFIVHMLVLRVAHSLILPHCKNWAISHPWYVLAFMCGAIMLLAVIGHHCVEKPAIRWGQAQLKRITALTNSPHMDI